VVYGQADDYRGEIVKACVVTKGKRKNRVSEADILAFCGERLAGYKVPPSVEFRDELPITATGKVLRRLLRDESN
jgi:acyl-CoA synthetase (AMP-forming)/AMP-acid ligase II